MLLQKTNFSRTFWWPISLADVLRTVTKPNTVYFNFMMVLGTSASLLDYHMLIVLRKSRGQGVPSIYSIEHCKSKHLTFFCWKGYNTWEFCFNIISRKIASIDWETLSLYSPTINQYHNSHLWSILHQVERFFLKKHQTVRGELITLRTCEELLCETINNGTWQ